MQFYQHDQLTGIIRNGVLRGKSGVLSASALRSAASVLIILTWNL